MARYLWLLTLALKLCLGATAVQAAIRICNDTDQDQQLAISARLSGSWVTEGWETLGPGHCVTAPPKGHSGRFFYYRAQGPGYGFRDDSIHFCTLPERFRIEGGKDCLDRGFQQQGFARARLDQLDQSDTSEPQILLGQRLFALQEPQAEQLNTEPAPQPDAPSAGSNFAADAVLESCKPGAGKGVTCRLVAADMQLSVNSRNSLNPQAFTFLVGLPQGAPLRVEGRLLYRFGRAARLELLNAEPRRANEFDNLRSRMQGEWQSAEDPEDQFTIRAVTRQAVFRGRNMAAELISIQPRCAVSPQQGQYLVAWEAESDTSLCYEIVSLTNEQLVLRYLPRGTELRYIRP